MTGGGQHRLAGVPRCQPGADGRRAAASRTASSPSRALNPRTHHAAGHDPAGSRTRSSSLDPGAAATYPDATPCPGRPRARSGREIDPHALQLRRQADLERLRQPAGGVRRVRRSVRRATAATALRNGDIMQLHGPGRHRRRRHGRRRGHETGGRASGTDGGWSDIEYGAQQLLGQLRRRARGRLVSRGPGRATVGTRSRRFVDGRRLGRYRDYRGIREWYFGGADALRSRHLRGRSRVHRADRGPGRGTSRLQGEQDPRRPRPQVRGRVLRPSVHAGGSLVSVRAVTSTHSRASDGNSASPCGDSSGGWCRTSYGGIPGCDACVIAHGSATVPGPTASSSARMRPDDGLRVGIVRPGHLVDRRPLGPQAGRCAPPRRSLRGGRRLHADLRHADRSANPGYYTDTPTFYPALRVLFPAGVSRRGSGSASTPAATARRRSTPARRGTSSACRRTWRRASSRRAPTSGRCGSPTRT